MDATGMLLQSMSRKLTAKSEVNMDVRKRHRGPADMIRQCQQTKRPHGREKKENTMKTKEDYIKQAKLNLDKLDAHIDLLEAQIAKKKTDAMAACHSQLAELKSKRTEMAQKIDAIKESSGEAWQSLKQGLDTIMDDVQTVYHNIKETLTR